MASETGITIVNTYDQLAAYRAFWEAWQWHPNTDLDGFIEWCQAQAEVIQPHVVVLSKGATPVALLIGRLERKQLKVCFGYRVVLKPMARVLSVLYGGVLGDATEEHCDLFMKHLLRLLGRNEADVVFLNQLRMDLPLFSQARRKPPLLCRDLVTTPNVHWRLELASRFKTYDAFVKSWSSNFRRPTNKCWRKLREAYDGRIFVQRIDDQDLDCLFATLEAIASKTYHREIGGGFQNDAATRRRLMLSQRRGLLRVWVMFVDQKPAAFWLAIKFKGVVYPEATGYDPAFAEFSPGRLLLCDLIRQLMDEGDVTAVDFGFGDAGYKTEICNTRWHESSVHVFAPTIRGVAFNVSRALVTGVSMGAAQAVASLGLTQKLKTLWRRQLADKSKIG